MAMNRGHSILPRQTASFDDPVTTEACKGRSGAVDVYHSLLEELSPYDFFTYEKSLLHDYHPIYNGLFDHPLYEQWLEGRQWRLRCHSTPRSGKTTFAAAIAQNIRYRQGLLAVPIFLDVPDENRRSLLQHADKKAALSRCILRSIVEQKLHGKQQSALLNSVQVGNVNTNLLSTASIEEFIASEAVDAHGVFVILDGYTDDEVLTQLHSDLNTITNIKFGALSIELSARFPELLLDNCNMCEADPIDVFWRCRDCPEPDEIWADFCRECFEKDAKCVVDESHTLAEPYMFRTASLGIDGEALRAFIVQKLQEEVSLHTSLGIRLRNCVDEVAERIFDKSENSFAIARLNIEHLVEHQSLTDVVGTFGRVPRYVNEYFDGLMQTIVDSRDCKIALAALVVASSALHDSRPLTCDELNGALQRYFGLDHEGPEVTKENIGLLTNGLLAVSVYTQEGQQNIETFHADVSTYLNEECDEYFTGINPDMALLCIERVREFLQLNNDVAIRDVLQNYLDDAFLKYAWEFWGSHFANHNFTDAQEAALGLLNDLGSSSLTMNRAIHLMRITAAQDDERSFYRPYSTPFHICAHFGLVALADEYLKSQFSTNKPRTEIINSVDVITGATPLMIAVQREQLDFVRFLLNEGADHDLRDYFDHSPLSQAIERTAQSEDTAILDRIILLLLAKLSDSGVNRHVMGTQTLLLLAIEHNQDGIIKILLDHANLDLGVTDGRGRNLIHVAMDNVNCKILPIVATTHGQSFKKLVNQRDNSGRSPLVALVQNASDDATAVSILCLLSTCGADFAALDDRRQTALHHAISNWVPDEILNALLDHGLPMNEQDCAGHTALHIASAANNRSAVDTLLQQGAKHDIRDTNGYTALEAARQRQSNAALERLCIDTPQNEEEGDEDDDAAERQAFSTLPLWQQVREDSKRFTELYSSTNVQLYTEAILTPDPVGQTALHWAVESVDREAIGLLLQNAKIDPNARDANGNTALQMAVNKLILEGDSCEECLQAIDKLLLPDPRIDSGIANARGLTILQQAVGNMQVMQESLDLAFLLISHRVPLELPRHQLQFLYEKAVAAGMLDLLDPLMKAGAHPLQCRLPFCAKLEVEDEDELDCVQRAHKLADEALLALM